MSAYDKLPYFRTWLESNIGHTSTSRSDVLVLGDFIKYCLGNAPHGGITNFHIKYRGNDWFVGLSIARNSNPIMGDEIVIELTDDALSSILSQCDFNEGSVLHEQRRQGQANQDQK